MNVHESSHTQNFVFCMNVNVCKPQVFHSWKNIQISKWTANKDPNMEVDGSDDLPFHTRVMFRFKMGSIFQSMSSIDLSKQHASWF